MPLWLVLVAALTAEPPYLVDAVALDEGASEEELAAASLALTTALGARRGLAVLFPEETTAPPQRLARARELLVRGEEQYINFAYGPAAAALAEAAGLFTVVLAELSGDDLQALYRARLIEGLAWLESGQPEAARDAFAKLAVIRPDYEPDPTLMPPDARVLYQQAVGEVMARGSAILEVRSDPVGARVLVDGIPRGDTPVAVSGLPVGAHGVRVVLAGHDTHIAEVSLSAGAKGVLDVKLPPKPALVALERVRVGAARGLPVEVVAPDLTLLRRAARTDVIIVAGVARDAQQQPFVTVTRIDGSGARAAALARAGQGGATDVADAARRAAALLAWPAAQAAAPGVEQNELNVDYELALLGVTAQAGRHERAPPSDSGIALWAGVGAGVLVAAAVSAVALAVVLTPTPPPPQNTAEVVLVFTP